MTGCKSISFVALLAAIATASQIAAPAMAEYWGMADAPEWSAADGYSRQSWGFGTRPDWRKTDLDHDGDKDAYLIDEPGYAPDVHADNDHGRAFFIGSDFGDTFAWNWVDQGPMLKNWDGLQGMVGGMGTGAFDFAVPGHQAPGRARQLWIQYVVYLSNGQDGSATETVLAADSGFVTRQGTCVDKKWHRIGRLDDQGAGGQWWRVSESWLIDKPGPTDYIRIRTTKGSVTIIDSVDIMTRTVDVDQGEKEETLQ